MKLFMYPSLFSWNYCIFLFSSDKLPTLARILKGLRVIEAGLQSRQHDFKGMDELHDLMAKKAQWRQPWGYGIRLLTLISRSSLQRELESLREKRSALLRELENLTEKQLAFKPSPDQWSILEVIEYLVLSERKIFTCQPDPPTPMPWKRNFGHRIMYFLVVLALKFRVPVPVASDGMRPKGDLSLVELRMEWDDNHRWLRNHLSEVAPDARNLPVFCHPVAGPITLKQAIILDKLHLHAHLPQIKRNKQILRDQPPLSLVSNF